MYYKIIYLPVSLADLEAIFEYIAPYNQKSAGELLDTFDKRIGDLARLPQMGKIVSDTELQTKGYRVLVIKNYYVFYIVYEAEKLVKIYRILSSRQDYLQWVE